MVHSYVSFQSSVPEDYGIGTEFPGFALEETSSQVEYSPSSADAVAVEQVLERARAVAAAAAQVQKSEAV